MNKEKVVSIVVKNGKVDNMLICDSVADGINHANNNLRNYEAVPGVSQIVVIKQEEKYNEQMLEFLPTENKKTEVKNLNEKLIELDTKYNAEDRVIYQVMDLVNIKYNGIKKMAIDEEVIKLIDQLILDWMWMYKNGYSLQQDPRAIMNFDDENYYSEMCVRFTRFQDFMRYNMNLCD